MQNNKTVLWVVIVLVILVGAFFLVKKTKTAPSMETDTTVDMNNSTEDTTEGSVNTSAAKTLSYNEALAAYPTNRIQLDKVCQAHPNNVTYKNGTSIMIDNRSPQPAKVKLGSTFTIRPYSFKIIKLSSATLPSTLLLDCGTSQNVATVLIQK